MITKSNFTDYLTCNNLYYLKSILKEEYILSDFTKSLLEQGNEIGYLARGYFGDYVLVDATDNIEKVKQTEKYINEGQKVICEASFLFEDLFCQIDILRINDDGQYEIYEVKSSSKVQEYHLYDISFQTYVLKKLGLPVSSSYLVLLNNEYIKIGDLDLKGFFNLNLINEFKEVEEFVDEIRNMSELSSFKPCSDCSGCPYHSRCFKDMPKENIFNLAGLTKKNDLYNDGVITYDDYIEYVKRENKKGKLVNKILEQIEYERNDKGTKVNKKELRNF